MDYTTVEFLAKLEYLKGDITRFNDSITLFEKCPDEDTYRILRTRKMALLNSMKFIRALSNAGQKTVKVKIPSSENGDSTDKPQECPTTGLPTIEYPVNEVPTGTFPGSLVNKIASTPDKSELKGDK